MTIALRIRSTATLAAAICFAALASTALMAQTAHLGGQIRHTEIRSGALNANNPGDTEPSENGNEQKDDDD